MFSGFSGLNMKNTEKKNRLEASLYCYYRNVNVLRVLRVKYEQYRNENRLEASLYCYYYNVNVLRVIRVKYEEYRKEEPVRGFTLLLLL